MLKRVSHLARRRRRRAGPWRHCHRRHEHREREATSRVGVAAGGRAPARGPRRAECRAPRRCQRRRPHRPRPDRASTTTTSTVVDDHGRLPRSGLRPHGRGGRPRRSLRDGGSDEHGGGQSPRLRGPRHDAPLVDDHGSSGSSVETTALATTTARADTGATADTPPVRVPRWAGGGSSVEL